MEAITEASKKDVGLKKVSEHVLRRKRYGR